MYYETIVHAPRAAKRIHQDSTVRNDLSPFCHYGEQFYVNQAEQFSDSLCGQKAKNKAFCQSGQKAFVTWCIQNQRSALNVIPPIPLRYMDLFHGDSLARNLEPGR